MAGKKVREVDEYFSVSDFAAGIFERSSPNTPPGAATVANTYRCKSYTGGMLGPTPKLTGTISSPVDDDAVLAAGDVFLSEQVRFAGVCANDPVFSDETKAGTDQSNTEIYLATEYWWSDDSDGDQIKMTLQVWRYSHHEGVDADWEMVWDEEVDKAAFDDEVRPKRCGFVQGRSNSTDAFVAGPLVIGWVYDGWAVMFPDDTAPTVNGTVDLPGSLGDLAGNPTGLVLPADVVGHQGRFVVFPLTLSGDGTVDSNAIVYTSNEAFYWTESNNWTILDTSISGFFNVAAFLEIPTGYSIIESLTANELLLIKAKGGGGVLRGSLNDFTAISKPLLRGTGHSQNRGTRFPGGFVYPVDGGGVWLYPGGDTCVHLTEHMGSDFWRPDPVKPANGTQTPTGWGYQFTGCATWGELALLPNNYFLDFDTFDGSRVSVWRIEDPDEMVAYYWTVDWRQRWAWAVPSGNNESTQPALFEFDNTILADTYSHQGHPLPIGGDVERIVNIREVIIEATGVGEVTITVTSGQGETDTVVFDLDAGLTDPDHPRRFRKGMAVHGSHIQVRIEADSGDPDTPAPFVHSYHLGHNVTHRASR